MRVLITGASSGIGRGVATRLHAQGHEVLGVTRDAGRLPAGIAPVVADLSLPHSIAEQHELFTHTPLDAFVHSAGIGLFGPIETTPLAAARAQCEVNLMTAVDLAQRVIPGMRNAGGGRIVLVSSIAAACSSPLGGWYHASKAALEAVADALRMEVAGFNIDVVIIQPGPVRTPFLDVALETLPERTSHTPYGQAGHSVAETHQRMASAAGAEVENVVDVIERALFTKKPRTRYTVGRGSRLSMLLPAIVPDRLFDAMMRQQFGVK